MGIVSVILVIFSEDIIRFFIQDEAVIQIGANGLRFMSFGFIAYALGMVLVQAFNGAGDTFTPMFISIISFWMMEIPLAYYMALNTQLRESGVFISILISESSMTLLSVIFFVRGKWKLKKV
jgi:Na+-driven multidrug efflux pump